MEEKTLMSFVLIGFKKSEFKHFNEKDIQPVHRSMSKLNADSHPSPNTERVDPALAFSLPRWESYYWRVAKQSALLTANKLVWYARTVQDKQEQDRFSCWQVVRVR